MSEFARHGYHAASTSAIAKRAGISQPYIYALFPDKEALFLACYRRACEDIRAAFTEAARGTKAGEERLHAMGQAYHDLLGRRDQLLVQLQAFATAGDGKLRKEIRDGFVEVMDDIRRIAGGAREEAADFVATGMLLNILTALEVPEDYWTWPVAAEDSPPSARR
jgi:AcrR family transcriptional regulator